MSNKIEDIIAAAISKADSSYFNEDYTKQARAVLSAIEGKGYAIVQTKLPKEIWQQAAEKMQTGRMKPDEHVEDVYKTVVKLISAK